MNNKSFKIPRVILRKFNNFWVFRIDPFVLGLYRIFLGGSLVTYYLLHAPNWLKFYGPGSISINADRLFSNYRLLDPILLYLNQDWQFWLIWAISLFFALALTFGVFWRLPVVWLWFMNYSIIATNPHIVNGEEQIWAPLLFFSIFLPLNAALSIPSWYKRRKGKQKEKVLVWALRPLQIYVALIYLISWPIKFLSDLAWRDGTVIYYATQSLSYSRWPGIPVFVWGNAIISRILTYFSLVVELSFPLFVWFRKFRLPLTLAVIFLHFGMIIFLSGVWLFNLGMLNVVILFLPSSKTRKWFRKTFLKEATLIYDGHCGLCLRTVEWLKLLNWGGRITLINFRNKAELRGLPKIKLKSLETEIHLITETGEIKKGFFVYRSLAKILPSLYILLPIFYFPGSKFFGQKVYNFIGRNRFKYFSKDNCHACQIRKK